MSEEEANNKTNQEEGTTRGRRGIKQATEEVVEKKRKEKFYRVQFQAKSHPNDEDMVTLSVNGEMLVIQREHEVVVPERFLEVANHAIAPQYRQLPGVTRKVVGKIQTFPYTILGEATESEFVRLRNEGNKATKKLIAENNLKANQSEA
ncbi:MAG: hypothetical protein A2020_12120 [Lentisphaerae bacterium GWF2_45_14]|nr:MAG: hypothetical protein A2020_12120 [Lentisphaerae bacterium GWF2_45_14]